MSNEKAHRNHKIETLDDLRARIKSCRLCAPNLPHEPRPVVQVHPHAVLCIAGQAPGTKVHASGLPFDDRSGDRLRDWMGIDRDVFYDSRRIAIVPMGFCFPGQNEKGGDLPPRRECAPAWRDQVFEKLPKLRLTLLVGQYAQKWHLGEKSAKTLTETVRNWRRFVPHYLPLPHPSWRNTGWIKKNPWFEAEIVPYMQSEIRKLLSEERALCS